MVNQSKSFSKTIFGITALAVIFGMIYFLGKSDNNTNELINYLNIATTTDQVQQNGNQSILEYKHTQPDFSFKYPAHYEISNFKEDDGSSTIVFKDLKTKNGFQIYLSQPKQNVVLTREAIKRDFPQLAPTDVDEAIIGDGKRVIIFISDDPALGKMREVWFIHGQYFYQITADIGLDTELAGIMNTFRL